MGAIIKGVIDFPVAPLALRLDRLPTITYGRHTWLLRLLFSLTTTDILHLKLSFQFRFYISGQEGSSFNENIFSTTCTSCVVSHNHISVVIVGNVEISIPF